MMIFSRTRPILFQTVILVDQMVQLRTGGQDSGVAGPVDVPQIIEPAAAGADLLLQEQDGGDIGLLFHTFATFLQNILFMVRLPVFNN